MGKVSVVVGGQYGSEAKGAVAGRLASLGRNTDTLGSERQVVGVRVGGPNAGHTVYGKCPTGCTDVHTEQVGNELHPWRLRQVPVAAVTNRVAALLIAAGSEIDPVVLKDEIEQLDSAGYNVSRRLMLDRSATILTQEHIEREATSDLTDRLGSTAKGIGAARSDRIWRIAKTVNDEAGGEFKDMSVVYGASYLTGALSVGAHVVVEGTQGYGLGLHTSYYPQVTSGDTRAIDFLAQAGISPWANCVNELEVWIAVRTKPIRVAGNSGPMVGETSWDKLGIKPEKTTVTRKTRRVARFDTGLVAQAVHANGGINNPKVKLALMMVDYEIPGLYGRVDLDGITAEDRRKLMELVWYISEATESRVFMLGTSPTTIIEL